MADPLNTERNQLPKPSLNFSGMKNADGGIFSRIARLWRPKDAPISEPLTATVSRYAQRLVNRRTGEAYSADELMGNVDNESVNSALEEDPAASRESLGVAPLALSDVPLDEVWDITGSLGDGTDPVTFPRLRVIGTLNGKKHAASEITPPEDGYYYESFWDGTFSVWVMRRRVYAAGVFTGTAAVWSSAEDVATPDLVTTWTNSGSPTSTGTPTVVCTAATTADFIGQSAIVTHTDATKTEWVASSTSTWLPRTAGIALNRDTGLYERWFTRGETFQSELLPDQ